jgi:hypothetical protein
MHIEVAQVLAERELRSQHKYTMAWSKSDQADENMWTLHDNNKGLHGEPLIHGMPYGVCTVCEYMRTAKH